MRRPTWQRCARAPARASDDARAILNTYWWGVCVDAVRCERQDRPAGRAREWREVLDYEGAVRPRARAGAGWMMCWAACAHLSHAHPRGACLLVHITHARMPPPAAAGRFLQRRIVPDHQGVARPEGSGSRACVCACACLLCPRAGCDMVARTWMMCNRVPIARAGEAGPRGCHYAHAHHRRDLRQQPGGAAGACPRYHSLYHSRLPAHRRPPPRARAGSSPTTS